MTYSTVRTVPKTAACLLGLDVGSLRSQVGDNVTVCLTIGLPGFSYINVSIYPGKHIDYEAFCREVLSRDHSPFVYSALDTEFRMKQPGVCVCEVECHLLCVIASIRNLSVTQLCPAAVCRSNH
jgi:hypothetical protein